MAVVVTKDARFNGNPKLTSLDARGGGLVFGLLAVTYSGTGGMTVTGVGFSNPFMLMAMPASTYMFDWLATTSQLRAYQFQVTSTAGAVVVVEVASDTDFTALADGGIRFAAVGYT